jgi:CHAT domain-containing protein
MTDATLYHVRAQAMLDFAEGKITETLAKYAELLNSDPPLTAAQELSCRMDHSTVCAFANRWKAAHADLDACEASVGRLPRVAQKLTLGNIYHARVKLLANRCADGFDLAAAKSTVAQLRAISVIPWLADELESDLAMKSGEWSRALEFSSNALRLFEAEGWRKAVALMRKRLGEARMHLNQFDLAAEDLAAARSFFKEFGSPDDRASADMTLAQLESLRGNHDRAWELVLQSLADIESVIRNFRVVSEQQQFLVDKLHFYDDAFDIGLAAGGRDGLLRAWTIAERAKSFYLCHLLANADVRLFDGIDPKAIAQLAELEAALDSSTRAAMMCDESCRQQKIQDLEAISEQRLKLLFQMMRDNPRWAAMKAPSVRSVKEILGGLPELWVPVSYFWREREGGADLSVFFSGPDKEPRHTVVSWSSEELQELEECHRLLARGYGPVDPSPTLRQLRNKLFPDELVNALRADNCLLISPHSRLRGFPIHALDLGDEDWLINHWPVQYAPTLAMLTRPRRTVTAKKALFLGCPETVFNPVRLREVEAEIGGLADLWTRERPGTVDRSIVPREGSPQQSGFAISGWRDYRMLHLSCHGEFPPGRPFDAALLLGSKKVYASDLFTISLQASFVTLSACNLGMQANAIDGASSDEWVGMYLPLFYSGAGNLLVSLWEADSSTTQGIMERLHLGIARGRSPASALQQALSVVSESSLVQLWANWYLVGIPEMQERTSGNTINN